MLLFFWVNKKLMKYILLGLVFFFINNPLSAVTGEITIHSSPSGAIVYMDGHYMGKTPLAVTDILLNQTYTITVEKWGFQNQTQLITINEKNMSVEFVLEKQSLREERPNAVFVNILAESLFFNGILSFR